MDFNLIAGRRLATELMQGRILAGETLARELLSLLEPQRNAQTRAELNVEVMKKIGELAVLRSAPQTQL
jgi:hypothetical protein